MAQKIKITTDSTCDIPASLRELYNIDVLPLNIHMGDGVYKDGLEITPKDIVKHVDNGGALCSTSAVNVFDYEETFKKFLKDYDAVIHVNIGDKFSSCHQNARIAIEDLENVYVINSESLAIGQGMVAIWAAELSKTMDAVECVKVLEERKNKIDGSFVLEKLDYMNKGGRCSSVTAFGANLLKLKPCIELIDGELKVGKKYRVSMKKCLEQYINDRLSDVSRIKGDKCYLIYSGEEWSLDFCKQLIEEKGIFDEIVTMYVGCTIMCHCGPGTVGIFFETV